MKKIIRAQNNVDYHGEADMEERRRAILREVEEKGKVRVADLSKELDES